MSNVPTNLKELWDSCVLNTPMDISIVMINAIRDLIHRKIAELEEEKEKTGKEMDKYESYDVEYINLNDDFMVYVGAIEALRDLLGEDKE